MCTGSARSSARGMSNADIDDWYELAMANGAVGGKLIGAGRRRLPDVLRRGQTAAAAGHAPEGLSEVRFRFDFHGAAVVFRD